MHNASLIVGLFKFFFPPWFNRNCLNELIKIDHFVQAFNAGWPLAIVDKALRIPFQQDSTDE